MTKHVIFHEVIRHFKTTTTMNQLNCFILKNITGAILKLKKIISISQ